METKLHPKGSEKCHCASDKPIFGIIICPAANSSSFILLAAFTSFEKMWSWQQSTVPLVHPKYKKLIFQVVFLTFYNILMND